MTSTIATIAVETIEVAPGSPVATSGTITFTYPAGRNRFDYIQAGATLSIGSGIQAQVSQGSGFTLAFGTSTVVATWTGSATIPAGTRCLLTLRLAAPTDSALPSEIWGGSSDKEITPQALASASSVVPLTDAATITPNLSAGANFSVTLGGNRTLAAPLNMAAGRSGFIRITQDGTGTRTLAFNAAWKFQDGVDPTLTTTAGAMDVLFYTCLSSTEVVATLLTAVA